MTQLLPVFTPSLAPREVLERLLVARNELLDDIVERIATAGCSPARNHTLLIGPRGAGKTHLVTLAYHRAASLRDRGEISVQLAWLPEDPWSTTSYPRLLRNVVDHLEPAAGPSGVSPSVDDIEAMLLARSADVGPVVLFVENLDQVLDAIGPEGQQRLRRLAQAGALLFVASTTNLSRDLSDQAAPFYSFFTTTRLEPLTIEQATEMLARIAAYEGSDKIAAYLATDEATARLRAVAHLAGGQPRIWALLGRALTISGLEQLVQLLLTRFDELTPYYQEQLARLSPQQRDVVVTLVELDHPASVKELAELTGVDQRSLGKTMIELRDRGWVVETDSLLTRLLDQRRTYYELGEPLARLAFQLKASRGTPIGLVVDFLKSWFDPADLTGEPVLDQVAIEYVRHAAAGYKTDAVLAVSRRLHALPVSRVPVLDLLGRLDDACAALVAGDAEPLLTMPSALRSAIEEQLAEQVGDDVPLAEAVAAVRIRLHREALDEFGYVPQPIGLQWIHRARALVGVLGKPVSMGTLVDWLGRMWQFDEAEEVRAELVRLVDADNPVALAASGDLANSYWSAGRTNEATTINERVAADSERILGPDHPDTLIAQANLATFYWSARRTNDAIAIEERVTADSERILGPDHPDTLTARSNLATSYWSARRTNDAIAIDERVTADRERILGPDHPSTLTAWANLAVSYSSAGRTSEAIAIEERVAADSERILGPDHPDTLTVWFNLAVSYWRGGRATQAIALLKRAVVGQARVLGEDHPTTVGTRGYLETLLRTRTR